MVFRPVKQMGYIRVLDQSSAARVIRLCVGNPKMGGRIWLGSEGDYNVPIVRHP